MMKKRREGQGTSTEVQWVHSHVDDKQRQQVSDKSRHQCCCKGKGGKCDPMHPRHIGNSRADELATEGLSMAQSSDDAALSFTTGEERYHMIDHIGAYCDFSASDADAASALAR